MNTSKNHRSRAVLTMIALALVWVGARVVVGQESSGKYFRIQVVDRRTGRGVPLVELRTTNSIRYITDSNGIVAFHEPGLMDRDVFFFVESHGYEFPKDGFGFRGQRLKTTPGTSAVLEIDRINIAERLYRVTGQGIYRDSVLTGTPVPLTNPVINGQVSGQDSVFAWVYHGRLFWLWGDTNRPSYPLGHFWTAGAVSDLPSKGGLDPSVGVGLEYFVDDDGFSRPLARLKEEGLMWLDALLTVQDPEGNERLVAKFARLKSLAEVLERGLVVFNDDTERFEPLLRPGLELLPYRNTGHAFPVEVDNRLYYYFTSPSPMGARLRVRAQWDDVIDPNRYEVLTALGRPSSIVPRPSAPGWVKFSDLIASRNSTKVAVIEALEKEAKGVQVYDIESGKAVSPHNGSVYFNSYRQKWIGIFVQQFGDPSFLGEVWYAEADTPVGPWAYARKIVTHNKYSFYNPKQHPFFDQDGGRVIYFEGTYSYTFSGSPETATPRYDYNQIMYRLNLDDSRLALPVAVYQVRDEQGDLKYLLRGGVETAGLWDNVDSVAFYAVEPERASNDLVGIYAHNAILSTERPDESSEPLFCALSTGGETSDNAAIASLYEYHHTEAGHRQYSTDPAQRQKGWIRTAQPRCRVWKAPPGPLLLDREAKPYNP